MYRMHVKCQHATCIWFLYALERLEYWIRIYRDPVDPVFQHACNHTILSLSLVDACTGCKWHACLTHACHMVFAYNGIRIIVIQIQYSSRRVTTQSSLIDACAGCMWHACLTRPCSACKQRTPSAARTVLWSPHIEKDWSGLK